MTIQLRQYIPCLRWKQGEYQAVMRLSSQAKAMITPLIEVPEIGFDFETRQASKSIDDHLEPFAKRVRKKWGTAPFFADFRIINPNDRMADGSHPIRYLLNDLRYKGAKSIPVVRPGDDSEYQRAAGEAADKDGRGLCIRMNLASVSRADLQTSAKNLLDVCNVSIEETDFIIDLQAPNFEPVEIFTDLLENLIRGLPYRDRWRSLGVIGTSFPISMAEVRMGFNILPRHEWALYKALVRRLEMNGMRIPIFGDYAINHPQLIQMDMRLVKPFSSLRYTIRDNWLIGRGKNVRDHGFGQYQFLCDTLVNSNYFEGSEFSVGDKYIDDCAKENASTGNLTTWRWVGTNHHIERIVTDFATQNDS